MLAGALLRVRFDFFFPGQLAAYALFAVGSLLLWPAVAVLAARVGARGPGWGLWGGLLAMSGLFARTFHAGADHMAFRLAAAGVALAAWRSGRA
ncbi:hypothetical protein KGD83_15060 [Nocardiopsis akebiae]|uniref:Uncharacterized protein n=1 Tax=Nocardiopsis akebiae TaxID=2831968 RepID=A0ABX8C0U8_9ACTN|nr:hypothetical protein [Nocardiopsis akebiae]QUX26713.1 hypothetical protein KGD83_15060 [Nocardiopsis akebiae]